MMITTRMSGEGGPVVKMRMQTGIQRANAGERGDCQRSSALAEPKDGGGKRARARRGSGGRGETRANTLLST